jgi:hypothetical protein
LTIPLCEAFLASQLTLLPLQSYHLSLAVDADFSTALRGLYISLAFDDSALLGPMSLTDDDATLLSNSQSLAVDDDTFSAL